MKKTIAFLLVIVLMAGMFAGPCLASSEQAVTIYLEGKKVEFTEAQPVHTGSRVLVPVRGFFEKIGVTVDWNNDDKIVIVKDDKREIMLEVGNKAVLNNGALQYLDCSVVNKDGRTFIPLRYVSESFGYDVRWNSKTKSVHIKKKSGNTGGAAGNTSTLPTVDSLENLYHLLRYNDESNSFIRYNRFEVTDGPYWELNDTILESSVSQEMSKTDDATPAPAATNGSDYSGTNNQVEGIEEGDLIKTDGKYLYIARDKKINIVNADPDKLKVISEIKCDKGVDEIYIYKNKLILINGNSNVSIDPVNEEEAKIADQFSGWQQIRSTNVKVYDITNRAAPFVISDKDYEGTYLSSRMIDDDVYVVTNSRVRFFSPYFGKMIEAVSTNNKETFIDLMSTSPEGPRMMESSGLESPEELYRILGNTMESYITPKYTDNKSGKDYEISLDDIYYFKDMVKPNYMITVGVDLDSGKEDINAYLGSSERLYVSSDHMYTALDAREYSVLKSKLRGYPVYEDLTSVHKFGLKDGKIIYKSNGKVPGTILNQFSMDEYNGVFRIATTINESGSSNNVYALDGDMKITGRLEGIAPGERIYSTRFAGERIYMVTFRQMDPFFVIDAADPRKLSLLGYLKIPGFSTYMHILDKDHVLGLGYDTEETKGGSVIKKGFKMSLFDVSDVKDPIEVKNEIIGEEAESLAAEDHKALMISLDKGIMGLPLAYINSGSDFFAGYYLYNVSNKDFSYRGRVSHYPQDAGMNDIKEEDMIYRGVYIGNNLYTFSEDKLQAYDLDTLKLKGSLSF